MHHYITSFSFANLTTSTNLSNSTILTLLCLAQLNATDELAQRIN